MRPVPTIARAPTIAAAPTATQFEGFKQAPTATQFEGFQTGPHRHPVRKLQRRRRPLTPAPITSTIPHLKTPNPPSNGQTQTSNPPTKLDPTDSQQITETCQAILNNQP